jgi:hypothetical protein
VNLRDGPSLDAAVLGSAAHGQLVFVTGSATLANGATWYPVAAIVGSGRTGFMAGAQGSETFLEPTTGTVAQEWCGRLAVGATEYDQSTSVVTSSPVVRFAGLELPGGRFEPGLATALSVAYGADVDVCMELTVTDAELSAVTVSDFETVACGQGTFFGPQGAMVLVAGDMGATGARDERHVWLHEALLGFDPSEITGQLPNFAQALALARGQDASGADEGCIHVDVVGGSSSTSVTSSIDVVGCLAVEARSSSEIVIARENFIASRHFEIVPNSVIAPELVPEAGAVGMRLTVAGGPIGVLTIEAAAVPGCGVAAAA